MNKTELFRDFLISRGIKQKFEKEYANNPNPDAAWRDYPLVWTDDFLTKVMREVDWGDEGDFLAPTQIIDWSETKDGYDFWGNVDEEWNIILENAIDNGFIDEGPVAGRNGP